MYGLGPASDILLFCAIFLIYAVTTEGILKVALLLILLEFQVVACSVGLLYFLY